MGCGGSKASGVATESPAPSTAKQAPTGAGNTTRSNILVGKARGGEEEEWIHPPAEPVSMIERHQTSFLVGVDANATAKEKELLLKVRSLRNEIDRGGGESIESEGVKQLTASLASTLKECSGTLIEEKVRVWYRRCMSWRMRSVQLCMHIYIYLVSQKHYLNNLVLVLPFLFTSIIFSLNSIG